MKKKPEPSQVLELWTERDLTAAARAGELSPAYEIEDTVEQACEILASGRHLVVTGEPGVGKSAVVHELVRRAEAGRAPACLAGRRVLQLSFRHRASALKEATEIRPEMQNLVEALRAKSAEVVPFFRDFHLAYAFDLETQLQALSFRFPGPILGEGEATAAATLFESWAELEQSYTTLPIPEPSLDRTVRILAQWAAAQEKNLGRRITPEALDEVLQLSHRFLSKSRLPRKALDLAANVLGATSGLVTQAEVIERFSKVHRVPRMLIDPAIPLDLSRIETDLSGHLLGQSDAVRTIVRMIGLIKSGLTNVRRPFGVFLFVGPTGVGKTHLAQLLAETLFGDRDRVLRINMADYQSERSSYALFGESWEDRISLRRGVLTQRVAGQPS